MYDRILVPLDGSELAECVLPHVEKIARDCKVKADSCLGNAADEIVDYAVKNDVDLIIMASHGRSGFARWADGSVADRVFRATCVPILMVRAPGCATGV